MYSGLVFSMAFVGGIIPALLWLWFWLREDKLHPEPRSLLAATFIAGMGATLFSLGGQEILNHFFVSGSISLTIAFVVIEELTKYAAAFSIALGRRENDEPIDNMIYLITAALGFSALENALYLLEPLSQGQIFDSIITGNMRFIGSTLLHTVSSAVIGIAMALAFCKLREAKIYYSLIGVVLAIGLHTLFNLSIMTFEGRLISIFGVVWVGAVILIIFFEKVKRINRSCVYD